MSAAAGGAAAGRLERAESELRPVPGPSALGGGGRRFLQLLWLMSVTEFKLSFHGTVLGYLWSLARPLMLFGVLLVVFTKVFRFGGEIENYAALLLLNIMLFQFFGEGTQRAVSAVVAHEGVVRKTQFPRLVIPLSIVLTTLLNLGLNLVVVMIFITAYGVDPTWTWLLLPVLVLALVVITTAAAMLLSALYPRFRDVALIWSVLGTTLFYATPVLYPIDVAPGGFKTAIQLNPLTPIFEQTNQWIIDPAAPGMIGAAGDSWYLPVVALALFALTCALAVWVFKREAPRIAEEL